MKTTPGIQPHIPFGLSTEQSTSLQTARNDGAIANDRTLLGACLSVILIIVKPRQLSIFGIPPLVRLALLERQENPVLSRSGTSHWHDR